MRRITKLLKDFRPEELGDKPTARDYLGALLLKIKAVIPMLIAIFLIWFVSGVYIFTYWVPLVFDDWNDWSYSFYEDKDKIPGIRKIPKSFQCILAGSVVVMFLIINISFFRAAFTHPGSLCKDEEWALRRDTLEMFHHKNQKGTDQLSIDIKKVTVILIFRL